MALDPLTAGFELGKMLLTRIWKDPEQQSKALMELEELKDKGKGRELNAKVQLMLAQIDVNIEQAKSKDWKIAGARPFIIWVCGFGLAFQYIINPLLVWVWAFASMEGVPPPPLDMNVMMPLLLGLLGLGGFRSIDKYNKVQTDGIK